MGASLLVDQGIHWKFVLLLLLLHVCLQSLLTCGVVDACLVSCCSVSHGSARQQPHSCRCAGLIMNVCWGCKLCVYHADLSTVVAGCAELHDTYDTVLFVEQLESAQHYVQICTVRVHVLL
jgi:hypothetical protein